MAALLLERGAVAKVTNGGDPTPLGIAEHEGHTEVAELLRNHDGAQVSSNEQH